VSLEENLVLSIKYIDDLLRCINLASLLEVSGWPKSGNVHRTKNFDDTRFEHFLAGISAIQPNFRKLCEHTYKNCNNRVSDFSFVDLGSFFEESSMNMINWQKGGNVLLGHILLLAPIAAATAICLKTNKNKFKNFKMNLNKVIEDASVEDSVKLYNAIRIVNPGGLGNIDKYDIYDENSITEIQQNNISLKKVFELSKEYDRISSEYSTGFNIILNEGLPYYFEVFSQFKDINIATVNTFFKILSVYPDTLIIRKSGLEAALLVSKKAYEIVNLGGITSNKGLKLAKKLDNFLHEKKGKMNPGTTADILVGIICCALIFGLRF